MTVLRSSRFASFVALAAVALVVGFALSDGVTAAHAAFPGANGLIAFESNQTGDFEVYVMNSDGTGQKRLTTGGATDPVWSPDGSQIAFARGFSGNSEIYVMDANGSNVRQVTQRPGATDIFPSWSPDGTRLAFASFSGSDYDIWVINLDGTGEVNITNDQSEDLWAVWQPNGSKIAFQSNRGGNREIYLVNSDGTGLTNITNNAAEDEIPDWSPDGTKLAFSSTRNGGVDIYVMTADGTGVDRLTQSGTSGFYNTYAAWSPDGMKIAFTSFRDFNDEIYVMNADGSGATRLTNNAPPGSTNPQDFFPDWQPLPSDDITAPVLTVPGTIAVNANSAAGATVSYIVTAADDVDPDPAVECAPPSGSVFAIGTTQVHCTATDSSDNTSEGFFTVQVKGADDQLTDLGNVVVGVGPGSSLANKVTGTQAALASNDVGRACSTLAGFGNQVKAQTGKTITPQLASALLGDSARIRMVIGC